MFQRIAKPFRISIHALLAESDWRCRYYRAFAFSISIHALLAESDRARNWVFILYPISIHALLAESDLLSILLALLGLHFYPRSPCGERRQGARHKEIHHLFLSTLSLRRATTEPIENEVEAHISIHALLAESDRSCLAATSCNTNFYPRSPCGERLIQAMGHLQVRLFLSTLSLRRATACKNLSHQQRDISIHALLAESD